jgi:hypothetical protein
MNPFWYFFFGIIIFWIIVGFVLSPKNKYSTVGSNYNKSDFKRFKARISFRKTWIFYAVFGLFFIFGVLLLLKTISGGSTSVVSPWSFLTNEQFFGLIIATFAALALFVIAIKNFAFGSWYGISPQGLLMVMTGYKNMISYQYIDSLSVIQADEVDVVMNNIRKAEVVPNPKTYNPAKASVEEMDMIRYLSVPIVHTDLGIFRIFTLPLMTRTNGSFVLLKLKDGKTFLLSPKEVDGYLNEVNKYFNSQEKTNNAPSV